MKTSGTSQLFPTQGRTLDVLGLCNALIDFIVRVQQADLEKLQVAKGIMTLVDVERQEAILSSLADRPRDLQLGGSCPNIIRVLAGLGAKTAFSGVIGKDERGITFKQRLSDLGVADYLQHTNSLPTGTCLILVTEDGERTMLTSLGASRLITKPAVPFEHLERSSVFFTTGYQWDLDEQIEAANAAIAHCRAKGTAVAFDMADPFCVQRHRDDFLALLRNRLIDIVFANRDEALAISGQSTAEAALDFLAQYTKVAVVKLGKGGSLARGLGQQSFTPSDAAIPVRDTTGAGDSYAGGFLFGLLKGLPLARCGEIANSCAEAVIQEIGAHIPANTLQTLRLKYAGAPAPA